jgi:hypothetical protein
MGAIDLRTFANFSIPPEFRSPPLRPPPQKKARRASSNQLSTLLPLITVCVANLLLLSPRSALTRRSTCSFETIDGKKSYDDPPHTNRVIRLDKMFRKLHGYSPMVNLVALVAMTSFLAQGSIKRRADLCSKPQSEDDWLELRLSKPGPGYKQLQSLCVINFLLYILIA